LLTEITTLPSVVVQLWAGLGPQHGWPDAGPAAEKLAKRTPDHHLESKSLFIDTHPDSKSGLPDGGTMLVCLMTFRLTTVCLTTVCLNTFWSKCTCP
jgi:hypothetical protein